MITYRDANSMDIPVLVSLDKELFPYSPWSSGQYREEISAPITWMHTVSLTQKIPAFIWMIWI